MKLFNYAVSAYKHTDRKDIKMLMDSVKCSLP